MSKDELVARMKEEILGDIKVGLVPETVKTFRELHDYVDANCYGGMWDDENMGALTASLGGRDEDGGMPQGVVDLLNAAQNEIDA